MNLINRALSGLGFSASLMTMIVLNNYGLCKELDSYSSLLMTLCFITMIGAFLLWE